MNYIWYKVLRVVTLSTILLTPYVSAAAECIVPANPGSEWDLTCRVIGKIMFDTGQVEEPMQVTNMSGDSGGFAYSHIVSKRGEDENLIVAASSATATLLAQNAYGDLSADQVRFLGAIGADPGVIVVDKDSEYGSLNELLDAVKADPSSVTFSGGSHVGGIDHLQVLMALDRVGFTDVSKVKYIGVDSGEDAATQTTSGVTQAMTGNISEVLGPLKSGEVRVLAVLANERIDIPPGSNEMPVIGGGCCSKNDKRCCYEDIDLSEIPTAKEQGVDVVAVNWRGLYVPKDIPEETYNQWAGALTSVAASKEWGAVMKSNGLAPFTMVGDDFQDYMDEVMMEIRDLSQELSVIK